jgi:outer membrane biosynthesis protein TonB
MALTRSEAGALGVAAIGHVVVLLALAWAGALAAPTPMSLKPTPIEVSITDDVGLESAAPEINTEPPKTQIAPEEGPVEPEAAPPEPAAQPQPAPAPQPVSRPQPQPRPAPAPIAKAAPQRPAPVAPPRAAPARTAPATNARPQPRPVRPTGQLGADFEKGLTAQPSRGTSQKPPATTIGAEVKSALAGELYRRLKPHWKSPTGADVDKLRTTVRAELNPDGSLKGTPRVVRQQGVTESNRVQAELHKERAIRAVTLAAPFKTFPEQYYDAWKVISPTFDWKVSQ